METERRHRAHSRRRTVLHVIRRGLPAVVLVGVLVALFVYFESEDHAPAPQTAPPPARALPVSTVVLAPVDVPLRPRFLGQTEASQVVEIRNRVSGFLEARSFEEGSLVEPGQVLFRIDPRSYQAEVDVAAARLAGAEAQLANARRQLERYEQLVTREAGTQYELEDLRTQEQVAAAEVRLAEAQLAQAQLDLSYTTIESPIRGLIGEALRDVGTYVSTGGDNLLAVVNEVDPIYVRYSVSERELLRWQAMAAAGAVESPPVEELEVRVTLADGQEYPLTGRIQFVDVRIDPSTGTALVRATVPNPERVLIPGQFVHATVLGIERQDAILVPQAAVMQNPTGASVYVVTDDQRVEMRPVELGEWYGDQWIVESGLAAGERVVVDQLLQLRPGAPVEPAPEAPEAPEAQAAVQ